MTEKEVIEFDLKCLRNVMNNFEDGLCEKMQEKVDNIKNYLEQKDKIIKYWKNRFERELESNRENVIEIIKQDKEIVELKEEINYWKECAEGEAGLRKQIQEDYQEQMQELLESEE